MTIYGRTTAAEIVRAFMYRPSDERTGWPTTRPAPILVFTSEPGNGKTRFLEVLDSQVLAKVPHALLKSSRWPAAGQLDPLRECVRLLERKTGIYGRLRFPRFVIGVVALESGLDANAHDTPKALARRIESAVGDLRLDKVDRALSVLVPKLPLQEWKRDVLNLASYLVTRIWRKAMLRRARRWWGHQDRQLGRDPIDALRELLSVRGTEAATDLLWDALLADLRNAFTRARKAEQWSLNCVLLVDDGDQDEAQEFLADLERAMARARDLGQPPPITVVSTQRPGRPDSAVEDVDHAIRTIESAATNRDTAATPYRVALRNLRRDEIDGFVGRAGFRGQARNRWTDMVEGFTGGHVGAVDLLLRNATSESSFPDLVRTLESELLILLEPEYQKNPQLAEALTSCAAAENIDHATRLAQELQEVRVAVRGMDGQLPGPDRWLPRVDSAGQGAGGPDAAGHDAGPARLPVVLRRVLLRQLARREPGSRSDWDQVMARLRTYYRGTDAELPYALAAEDLGFVTRRLYRYVHEDPMDVAEWLVLLERTTNAANRFDFTDEPTIFRDRLVRDADLPDETRGLARLVAGLWIDADPMLGERRKRLKKQIAEDFAEAGQTFSRDIGLFQKNWDLYLKKAEHWR